MKAQTKAILASLVVIAVALSAVSGVTYSWWSDSENTDITVGTGNLDVDVGGIKYWVGTGASGSFTVNEKPLQTNSKNDEGATSLSLITNIDNVAPRDQYFLQYDVTFSTTIYSKYMVQVETDVDWIKVDVKTVDDVTLTYNESATGDNLSGVKLSKWTSMPGSDVSPLDGVYASHARVLVTITILDNAPQKPVSGDKFLGDVEGYVDAHVSIVNIITQELNDSDIWNGLVGQVPAVSDGIMYIETAAELAAFAKDVNSGEGNYAGVTVRLTNDIDLNNIAWTPIGPNADEANKFKGIFDGQGHTIYNLYVKQDAEYKAAGLFGALNGTVKDLNIDGAYIDSLSSGSATDNGTAVVAGSLYNSGYVYDVSVVDATVKGNRYVGGIAGYAYGSITGCSVSDSVLSATPDELTGSFDNGDKVGGIVGYWCAESTYSVSNNTVSNIKLTAYRDVGGIIGSANYIEGYSPSLNSSSDVSIVVDQITNSYGSKDFNAGPIIGRFSGDCNTLDPSNSNDGFSLELNVKDVTLSKFDVGADSMVVNLHGSESSLNVSDAYIKLGSSNTKEFIINGVGDDARLTLETSYWSRLNLMNPDGVLKINSIEMTSSQESGTWNSYDITFLCDVELNNVDFLKAVALEANAKLNNVSISETHDYYALWITSNGQEVSINNLAVDSSGRGIKIDDQYESTPAKVTLNVSNSSFDTSTKAAIMVKSAAGADITVDNVDISKVTADQTNVVWVDEDAKAYANLVSVSGCTMINEP